MKTVLVILLWIGNPADWQTFKVPMSSAAECHKVAVAYFRTPEKEKPTGVLMWCDTRRPDEGGEGAGLVIDSRNGECRIYFDTRSDFPEYQSFTKGDYQSLALAILRAASAVLHSRGGV